MEKGLFNGSAGTFLLQIVNIDDDIDLNIFMSRFNHLYS